MKFYDIIESTSSTLDEKGEYEKRHQVIIFEVIQSDGKRVGVHAPLVSFCLEDVLNTSPEKPWEKVEIYKECHISRNGLNIVVEFAYDEEPAIVESNAFPVLEIRCNLRRSLFNNFNYIEKSIIDSVEDHEELIKQIISQVKKIIAKLS